MAVLLRDIVLDAAGLPGNWQEQLPLLAAETLHFPPSEVRSAEILSASVDSRRGGPKIILTLLAECPAARQTDEAELAAFTVREPEVPSKTPLKHPLIVGTGPAGIFAALLLARAGAGPVIVDRGAPVEERVEDYRAFLRTRVLDPESNLLIGEGGAGTFSDGKLYTGTRDLRAAWVKKVLAECGAPPEICWRHRAHVGSDHLAQTAGNLRKRIEALGGRFLFHREVTALHVVNGVCAGVRCVSGEILEAPMVLLAPGLGGRELVRGILPLAAWAPKPFQIGCRIEHPQKLVDSAMYHRPRPAALGAAEYHLVSRRHPRHVASFCMCPGGEVVNASAWEGRSVSNGMSRFARAGEFADSCLIATFQPGELGSTGDIDRLLETMERACFVSGGGDYALPIQSAAAFLRREEDGSTFPASPAVGVRNARIDRIIPAELFDALSSAVRDFDRRIPGFIREGRIIGVESCVSSPVRIVRAPETMESSLPRLYCAGEGCGEAGGIISAACDGIRCAEAMLRHP